MKKSKSRILVPFVIISIFSVIIALIWFTVPFADREPNVVIQSEQFNDDLFSMDSDDLIFTLDIENNKTKIKEVRIYLYKITAAKINEEEEELTLVDQMTVKEDRYLTGESKLKFSLEESTYYEIKCSYTYSRESLIKNEYASNYSFTKRFKTE